VYALVDQFPQLVLDACVLGTGCMVTRVRISSQTFVFFCDAAAICSLWHGLHLTAVPRSTVTATSAFVLWRKCRSSQQFYYRAMLCIRGTSHGPVSVCPSLRPSVCLSVTSRCSTKTAKRRITQTTPHDSPVTLVYWCQRSPRNSTGVTPYEGAECRWGGSKSATFDQ